MRSEATSHTHCPVPQTLAWPKSAACPSCAACTCPSVYASPMPACWPWPAPPLRLRLPLGPRPGCGRTPAAATVSKAVGPAQATVLQVAAAVSEAVEAAGAVEAVSSRWPVRTVHRSTGASLCAAPAARAAGSTAACPPLWPGAPALAPRPRRPQVQRWRRPAPVLPAAACCRSSSCITARRWVDLMNHQLHGSHEQASCPAEDCWRCKLGLLRLAPAPLGLDPGVLHMPSIQAVHAPACSCPSACPPARLLPNPLR